MKKEELELEKELDFLRQCIVYVGKHKAPGEIGVNTAYNWFITRYADLDDKKINMKKDK